MKVTLVSVDVGDREVLRKLLKEYQREILGKDPGEYKYFDFYWQVLLGSHIS